MRRLLILALGLLALLEMLPSAHGQVPISGFCGYGKVASVQGAGGFASGTIANTPITLSPPAGQNVVGAYMTIQFNPIRYTTNGVAPTALSGILVAAGSAVQICGSDVNNIRLVAASTTTGNADYEVQFYRIGS